MKLPSSTIRTDTSNSDYTYIGISNSLESNTDDAVWQIIRISNGDDGILLEYADGDSNPDNIWDLREVLEYK